MPLVAPNLDDRRFDDLLAELRTRIPRYTPEWTDHNDSDPGIIIGKLFAWITELTLYRVNRIPERAVFPRECLSIPCAVRNGVAPGLGQRGRQPRNARLAGGKMVQ